MIVFLIVIAVVLTAAVAGPFVALSVRDQRSGRYGSTAASRATVHPLPAAAGSERAAA